MKKIVGVGLVLLLAAAVLFIHNPQELKRYKTSFFDLFDTYTEITLYAADEAEVAGIAAAAKEELTICHQLYDIYHTYEGMNNLKTVNDNAGIAPVQVDARLIDLLLFGKEMYTKTGGQVNIAMGSVLALWHDHRTAGIANPSSASLPDAEALQAAAQHTDISQCMIDEQAMTVYLADPDMRLDVGAIAKGYAVERAAQQMLVQGAQSALISVGGNVRAIGQRADGTPWQVGVQNPDLASEESTIATVALRDSSMVTSGSYQRYYIVDGAIYHHIIDPETLMPSVYFQSVTIVTENSGIADVLSTALFTVPVAQGQAILERFPAAEAMWITQAGEQVKTDGFTIEQSSNQ